MSKIDRALELHKAGHLTEAEALYRQIREAQPEHADASHLLGVIAHQQGRHEKAACLIEQAIRANPRVPAYQNNLGEALRAQGKLDQAIAAYRQALALESGFADAYNNLGLACHQQGDLAQAARALEQAVVLSPDPDTYLHLGNVCRDQGQLDDAIDAYRRALALKPEFALACNNLGMALRKQGNLEEALAVLKRALTLDDRYAEAHYNLGIALEDSGERPDAIAAYRQALTLKPNFTEAHYNLGLALQGEGQLADAITAYEQALASRPDDHEVLNNLGHAMLAQGRLQDAKTAFERALTARPGFADAHSNLLMLLNYRFDVEPADRFAEHLRWGECHAATLGRNLPPHNIDSTPDRRLRIGYVSPDFRSHSVAFFVEPLLKMHDRARFDVFCYANVRRPDAMTERLQGLSDHWRDIVRLEDDEVARLIREDNIDILVDLAGHTAGNRLLVFARKPAPIQIAYLGYPNTRGFDAIDYWFTDALADPPGQSERFYVEEIVRLPNGFNCYQAPPQSPAVSPLPALKAGHISFGSFNNTPKINERVIACWAAILRAVPQARLILKARALADRQTRERFERCFTGHGIPAERIEMVSWIPSSADHLQLYHRIDIVLDTFPYNGHTTTCEALWMGVPVVTLAGQTHAGRVGMSLLTHVKLAELVAENLQAYVDIAVGLAHDLEHLAILRQGLRDRMKRSPLMDAASFTRALEQAYREMWKKYCEANSA